MKASLSLTLTLLAVITTGTGAVAAPKSLDIDTEASSIRWDGRKVTGSHQGTIELKGGELKVENKKLVGGTIEIDMTTIKNEDLKSDPKNQEKLTNHLRSDDFFGVAKHPTSKFVITQVTPAKSPTREATHTVAGDMTIKGKTHKESFPVALTVADGKAVARGKLKVDRTKYDVRYGSGKFFENLGDKMIHDEFELDLNIVAGDLGQ